jgi:hypothetical protein
MNNKLAVAAALAAIRNQPRFSTNFSYWKNEKPEFTEEELEQVRSCKTKKERNKLVNEFKLKHIKEKSNV